MIFNAILFVNHFVIYTQFRSVKDINLLFPRRSCSIGLESIHSVRKLNVVIFRRVCPLTILPFYPVISAPSPSANASGLSIAHIRRTQPSCSPQAFVRPLYRRVVSIHRPLGYEPNALPLRHDDFYVPHFIAHRPSHSPIHL